jgi:hypothetical protein
MCILRTLAISAGNSVVRVCILALNIILSHLISSRCPANKTCARCTSAWLSTYLSNLQQSEEPLQRQEHPSVPCFSCSLPVFVESIHVSSWLANLVVSLGAYEEPPDASAYESQELDAIVSSILKLLM